jgi:hypothetical protein
MTYKPNQGPLKGMRAIGYAQGEINEIVAAGDAIRADAKSAAAE